MFAGQLAVCALDQTTLNFGVTVICTPAGGSPVSIPAVKEKTQIETDQGVVWLAHDDLFLLIRISDYAAEPAGGDQFVVDGSTFQVSPINGKYYWEWADTFHLRRRVYMKRTSNP